MGEKYLDNNNTVMAHIARIREKLKEPARRPKYVKTVWGWDIPLSSQILRRSRISRRIMLRYVLSMSGFVAGLIIFVGLCWFLCSLRTWHYYEPLYQILILFKDYLLIFMTLIILAGWTVITHHFINLPLRYLDEIIDASGKLITSGRSRYGSQMYWWMWKNS